MPAAILESEICVAHLNLRDVTSTCLSCVCHCTAMQLFSSSLDSSHTCCIASMEQIYETIQLNTEFSVFQKLGAA